MPRKLRIEFEGAIYHVMNRGDRREPIFRSWPGAYRAVSRPAARSRCRNWPGERIARPLRDQFLILTPELALPKF